jgi:uncharacterized surface protein with fasciclin (FAS1) repeats
MKILYNIIAAGIFLIASTFSLGVLNAEAQDMAGNDVVSVLNTSEEHTVFAELIEEAQLSETLRSQGPFTVLAPNDEAFGELGGQLEDLRENPQQLQNVLINHLFQGEASSDEVETNFGVEVDDGDIDADNGVIHSIDQVIIER